MICEQCKAEGKKSTVHAPGGGISTLMCEDRYYDEDGNYHYHDPNGLHVRWRCSNGHEWGKTSYRECPSCEYNKLRQHAAGERDK